MRACDQCREHEEFQKKCKDFMEQAHEHQELVNLCHGVKLKCENIDRYFTYLRANVWFLQRHMGFNVAVTEKIVELQQQLDFKTETGEIQAEARFINFERCNSTAINGKKFCVAPYLSRNWRFRSGCRNTRTNSTLCCVMPRHKKWIENVMMCLSRRGMQKHLKCLVFLYLG